MNFEWLFPLIAVIISKFTPKGCDRLVNWILAGVFVLNWSFQEAIYGASEIPWFSKHVPYDGLWFDVITMGIFGWGAYLFHKSGGKVQRNLAIFAMSLCVFYAYFGTVKLYSNGVREIDMYYDEVFIALYIAQLFVAGGGMMFALSKKWINGAGHVINSRNMRHSTRHNNVSNGDS